MADVIETRVASDESKRLPACIAPRIREECRLLRATRDRRPRTTRGRARARTRGWCRGSSSTRCVLRRDDEHPKRLPAELTLMQKRALGCRVGEELSLEAGLHEVRAIDRHGAAVALDEEGAEAAVGSSRWRTHGRDRRRARGGVVVVDARTQHPRPLAPPRFFRRTLQQKIARLQQLKAGTLPDGALQAQRARRRWPACAG